MCAIGDKIVAARPSPTVWHSLVEVERYHRARTNGRFSDEEIPESPLGKNFPHFFCPLAERWFWIDRLPEYNEEVIHAGFVQIEADNLEWAV